MTKYQSRKCSIENQYKKGPTRLSLNAIELDSYLEDCVYSEEDDEEEYLHNNKNVSNPFKKTS